MEKNRVSDIENICRGWSVALDAIKDTHDRVDFFKNEFPTLLMNTPLFLHLMEQIDRGKPFPNISKPEMFDNEILLYMDPRRRFSLRIFLFGPGEYTPVHDHSAWGLTGTVFGPLGVDKYKRLDSRETPGYAELEEKETITLIPGDIDFTPILDNGIHKTGNPAKDSAICMVSIYGNPIRRLYVNEYDVEKNRVLKLYGPRLKKRNLARRLLKEEKTM